MRVSIAAFISGTMRRKTSRLEGTKPDVVVDIVA